MVRSEQAVVFPGDTRSAYLSQRSDMDFMSDQDVQKVRVTFKCQRGHVEVRFILRIPEKQLLI